MTHIEHRDEKHFEFVDIIDTAEYGRVLLFASSYLPPSINRSYRSYAIKYKPKNGAGMKWRAVLASSNKLREWKEWFSVIAEALLKESNGEMWFPSVSLASVKAIVVMGENSDVDGRTKAVQDVFQGCVFENDNIIGASCDMKLVTHKRKDQGVIYVLCCEDALFSLAKTVYDARSKAINEMCAAREHGETVLKMYQNIKRKIVDGVSA